MRRSSRPRKNSSPRRPTCPWVGPTPRRRLDGAMRSSRPRGAHLRSAPMDPLPRATVALLSRHLSPALSMEDLQELLKWEDPFASPGDDEVLRRLDLHGRGLRGSRATQTTLGGSRRPEHVDPGGDQRPGSPDPGPTGTRAAPQLRPLSRSLGRSRLGPAVGPLDPPAPQRGTASHLPRVPSPILRRVSSQRARKAPVHHSSSRSSSSRESPCASAAATSPPASERRTPPRRGQPPGLRLRRISGMCR